VGNTACECDRHDGLHITAETSLVEVVQDGRRVSDGAEGEILVTDLTNYAFPMIRYAIEDFGKLIDRSCECGRNLPLMSPGVGRVLDCYIAPDGTRHSSLALSASIADDGPPLGQIQYIQKSLMHYHLRITNDPPLNAIIENHIRQTLHKLISPEITITIEAVDELLREKSGKVRYFVNEIDS